MVAGKAEIFESILCRCSARAQIPTICTRNRFLAMILLHLKTNIHVMSDRHPFRHVIGDAKLPFAVLECHLATSPKPCLRETVLRIPKVAALEADEMEVM